MPSSFKDFRISAASPSRSVIQSDFPAFSKFSLAIGILFSYFSIVVIWQPSGAYALISNAENPIAVPTSKICMGRPHVTRSLNRLCICGLMTGTFVSMAYRSKASRYAGFSLSKECINVSILSSIILLRSKSKRAASALLITALPAPRRRRTVFQAFPPHSSLYSAHKCRASTPFSCNQKADHKCRTRSHP